MEGLSGIIVPLKNVIFSGFMTVFIYIKLIIKTILFFYTKNETKGMKVDRVKLYSLASYIRVRKVTEIRVWFMARQGGTQFLWWPDDGRWQPTDEHDNHSMVTETYLQDTLSAQFKTSQKATNTGFTPALIYSKLQIFFSFLKKTKQKD